MEPLWSPVVANGGNRRQIGRPQTEVVSSDRWHPAVIEECEHAEDASMVFFVSTDAELGEDARDVPLDGAFGEPEPACDAPVGAALRHEREYLALPRGELGQLVGRAERAQKQRDDLRVERRAAVGDAAERVEELVDVENTVLEQVAEAPGGRPARQSGASRCAGRGARSRASCVFRAGGARRGLRRLCCRAACARRRS